VRRANYICSENSRHFTLLQQIAQVLHGKMSLPTHERPSPANPSLQVQLCPPTVLVQFAFTSQSWLPVMHSSTSKLQKIKTELFIFYDKVDENVVSPGVYFYSKQRRNQQNQTQVILRTTQK